MGPAGGLKPADGDAQVRNGPQPVYIMRSFHVKLREHKSREALIEVLGSQERLIADA